MFNKNLLKAQIVAAGMTSKKLAERLEMNESTFYRKMNDDGNFTRSEINRMIDILNIQDPSAIFFAEHLA